MRYLIVLIFLFSATVAWSANIITNGKVGKVIEDKPIMDSAYFKVSDKDISDTILMGRAIVDAHRQRKIESYKTKMSHEDRVATNVTRLFWMRTKLKGWGFENEGDLISQSKAADIKAGVKEKERWK